MLHSTRIIRPSCESGRIRSRFSKPNQTLTTLLLGLDHRCTSTLISSSLKVLQLAIGRSLVDAKSMMQYDGSVTLAGSVGDRGPLPRQQCLTSRRGRAGARRIWTTQFPRQSVAVTRHWNVQFENGVPRLGRRRPPHRAQRQWNGEWAVLSRRTTCK